MAVLLRTYENLKLANGDSMTCAVSDVGGGRFALTFVTGNSGMNTSITFSINEDSLWTILHQIQEAMDLLPKPDVE